MARAGCVSGILSAVKLCQSSSISGPSATANPISAKISANSSMTWLTGCTVPRGASGAGSVISTRSLASRRFRSAVSRSAFLPASADVMLSRSPLMMGPWVCRSSGDMLPMVFSSAETLPCLPSAAIRTASNESSVSAESMAPIRSVWSVAISVIIVCLNKQKGANGKCRPRPFAHVSK